MARTPAVMKRLDARYPGGWLEADENGDFRMVVAGRADSLIVSNRVL
jgi:hypothetical protein